MDASHWENGMRVRARVAACLLSAGVLAVGVAPAAVGAEGFRVQASQVSAPTGMAADIDRGVYWFVNQNGAVIHGVDETGRLQRSVAWSGQTINVQAVSVSRGFVYVADIGDPHAQRDHVIIYRPSRLDTSMSQNFRQWNLVYPDGPRDAGAFAVSPRGNMYVVTRGMNPGVYRVGGDSPAGPKVTMTRVADAPQGVTDATFLPDGGRIAMRTYTGVHVYDAYTFEQVASAPLPAQGGGESLTVSLDSTSLLAADKAANAMVNAIDIPTSLTSLSPAPTVPPSVTPTPTPTPTPSPTVTASAAPEQREKGGPSNNTLIAVIGAVLVATAAAVVVAVKR